MKQIIFVCLFIQSPKACGAGVSKRYQSGRGTLFHLLHSCPLIACKDCHDQREQYRHQWRSSTPLHRSTVHVKNQNIIKKESSDLHHDPTCTWTSVYDYVYCVIKGSQFICSCPTRQSNVSSNTRHAACICSRTK